jgi:hypothetical protein
MPDPLVAEFVDDRTTIDKPKALTAQERRLALLDALNNVWPAADIGTLERIDDNSRKLHGWAMWRR